MPGSDFTISSSVISGSERGSLPESNPALDALPLRFHSRRSYERIAEVAGLTSDPRWRALVCVFMRQALSPPAFACQPTVSRLLTVSAPMRATTVRECLPGRPQTLSSGVLSCALAAAQLQRESLAV